MAEPSRREHARFDCRLAVRVRAGRGRGGVEGEALNIGVGGALLSLKADPGAAPWRVEIAFDGKTVTVEARPVHSAAPDKDGTRRYGVMFARSPRAEASLKLLVDRLRHAAPPGFDFPPLRDYWNP